MLLPQFGIEKMVRVCESCFDKRSAAAASNPTSNSGPLGVESSGGSGPMDAKKRAEEEARERARQAELEAQEQEELQLALAISQSEAEEKERQSQRLYSYPRASQLQPQQQSMPEPDLYRGVSSTPQPASVNHHDMGIPSSAASTAGGREDSAVDSVLAKYLGREYWEKRRTASTSDTTEVAGIGGYRASAPPPSDSVSSTGVVNAGEYGGIGYGDSASVVMGMRKREPSVNSINTMVQAFADMPVGNGTGTGKGNSLIVTSI